MTLKSISQLYNGLCLTVKEHVHQKTPLSEFLIDYSGITATSTGKVGEFIGQEKYSGYIGDLSEEGDIHILITKVSGMLLKLMLIQKMKLEEADIYTSKTIQNSIEHLILQMNRLTVREQEQLSKYIGEERWNDLVNRLNIGLINSFSAYEDSMMDRALWLFQIINFRRTKEWKWFRYRSCIRNQEIKAEINQLSKRGVDRMMEIISNEESPKVDLFPYIGHQGEIIVEPDLKINDKVFLISSNSKSLKKPKYIAVLNAIQLLSSETGVEVNEKYIYCIRWDQLLKIS
ncbi:hypothetical protein [Candidatus Mycoplasma haematohominis]|uniref:Uncharacterized protein n=1 Tax=Candidatus Mycoplasma haematohominis TaxID=1494318 RepID=A0A478FTC4_9MOLU|nr:hypothetical protein [Candidatus Mycoplasma haemohominis]GCE63345.1 hypothetical protein MHSWG343_03340 [Candidatus Mycoplasma haemohominis]